MIRVITSVFCSVLFLSSSYSHAITQQVGSNVDASIPPVPPCQSFGFSVEQTITLPTGMNNIIMLRVDRSGSNPFGYALTETATGYTVFAFDLRTMAQVGRITRTITGYSPSGRLQGDVGRDGKLYVFNEVSAVNPSCPASECVMFSRFTVTSLDASVVDATGANEQNIDDARESNNKFLVITTSLAGLRTFRTYDKTSLLLSATGTATGVSAFGRISRTINGRMYAGLSLTTPTIYTFPADSPTADNSSTITFAGINLLAAMYPILQSPSNLIALDSDSAAGFFAQRGWKDATTLASSGPSNYSGGLADGSASFQGAFYDSINNKVYSLRGTGGILLRTTPGVSGFTTEQNFGGCGAPCVNSGGTSSAGSQVIDYSEKLARLYIGSNETPARVSKIKVCAVGGPP